MTRRSQGRKDRGPCRTLARKLTSLAVSIAGRKRTVMDGEWRAHLSGETGNGLPGCRQVREAAGFLLAAVRYRLRDIAALAWRLTDAVLASRGASSFVVLAAALSVAALFIWHGGLYELAGKLGNVAVVWAAACGLIRVGRQWRDVEPPERRLRRKGKGTDDRGSG